MGSSNNRKQATFLINIQILDNPKRRMQTRNNNTNYQRQQHIEPNVSQHKPNHRNETQNAKHNSIIQRSVEDNKGAITWEVKKVPRDEDDQENNHGDRVPEEAEEDD